MPNYIYKYGIDYGTTNSSIGLTRKIDGEEYTTLFDVENATPRQVMPSRVCVLNGDIIVGREAARVHRGDTQMRVLKAVKLDLERIKLRFVIHGNMKTGIESITENIRSLLEEKNHVISHNCTIEFESSAELDQEAKKALLSALEKIGFALEDDVDGEKVQFTVRKDPRSRQSYSLIRVSDLIIESDPKSVYHIEGKRFETVDFIAAVLKRLREKAEENDIPEKISGVVMGCPVEFGDVQKTILMKALVRAGFYHDFEEAEHQTEFVSEPVAVAVDYGQNIKRDRNVLVFDFGGGTLDIAVMDLKKQVAINDKLHPHKVISKHRITLGGERLTEIFFINSFCHDKKYGISKLRKAFGAPWKTTPAELWQMMKSGKFGEDGAAFMTSVERLKCRLSTVQMEQFSFQGRRVALSPKAFARDDFVSAIKTPVSGEKLSAFDQIGQALDVVLKKANLDKDTDIDVVLTAGGSSLIPCVQEYLYEMFPGLLHEDAGKLEKLTSIARGLSIIGCHEETVFDDLVDNSYGYWDEESNVFRPVIRSGERVVDLQFSKLFCDGKGERVTKINPRQLKVHIKIYQESHGSVKELGCINIERTTSQSFTIYMGINVKKNTLEVYLYDNDRGTWLDDDGKVSKQECTYKLEEI